MNDSSPKITIIVPVYNVEEFLEHCIESILNQTFENFELICVDDGSTDNSLEIIQTYKNKDNRIKIISKKNEGVGIARNKGIEEAKGEWIYFIDSDDFIDKNYIEELYKETLKDDEIDVVSNSNILHYTKNQTSVFNSSLKKNFKDGVYETNFDNIYKLAKSFVIWQKLYRASIIKKYVRFANIKKGEDECFNFCYLIHTRKFSIINKSAYYYRIRENSLTNRGLKKYTDTYQLTAFKLIIEHYTKNNVLNKAVIPIYLVRGQMRVLENFDNVYLEIKNIINNIKIDTSLLENRDKKFLKKIKYPKIYWKIYNMIELVRYNYKLLINKLT